MIWYLLLAALAVAAVVAIWGTVIVLRERSAEFEREIDDAIYLPELHHETLLHLSTSHDPARPPLPGAGVAAGPQNVLAAPRPVGSRVDGRPATPLNLPGPESTALTPVIGVSADRDRAGGPLLAGGPGRVPVPPPGEHHERLPRHLTIYGLPIFPTKLASERYEARYWLAWQEIWRQEGEAWRRFEDGFAELEATDWGLAA